MDDIDRRKLEARRALARQDTARLETRRGPPPGEGAPADVPPRPDPAGVGPLVLAKRQGEWRYTLCDQRIRSGDAVEFYVDPRVGWVRGSFQWGRRTTSPPTIRVPVVHPDDASRVLGEMEVGLPDGALCRWP